MKAVACLLFFSLAGLVATQYAYKPGSRYMYKVRGRLMSGVSDINTQYAGMEMEYKIVLQVVSPTTIVLKPEDFKAVELNAELDGGWREAELENETPVEIKGEILRYLESPIELTMKNGIVDSMKVEDDLPTWAVNIKKAQASHFVLDTTGENAVLSGNLNRKTNAVRPEDENTDSGFFYEVMENTVLGTCETYYTVSQQGPFQAPYPLQRELEAGQQVSSEQEDSRQNQADHAAQSSEEDEQLYKPYGDYQEQSAYEQKYSEAYQKKYYYAPGQEKDEGYRYYKPQAYSQYQAYKEYAHGGDEDSAEDSRESRDGELPWPKAFDTFCNKDDQIYEITKSVNFSACSVKPTLSYTSASQLHGRGGDNSLGSAFDRFVISRILACGKDRKQYTVLSIKQEEQFSFGLRLNQKTMAGTTQNFTLVSITKAQVPIKVQRPKVIDDLSYTFDPQEQRLQKEGRIDHGYADEGQDNDSTERPSAHPSQSDDDSSSSSSSESQEHQQPQHQQPRRLPRSVSAESSSSEESQETKDKDSAWFKYDTAAEGQAQLPKPSMKRAPVNPYLSSPLKTSGLKKRIQDLMKEICDDILTDKQSMAEAETMSKISTVAKILRYLDYSDIQELYQKIAAKSQTEQDQTARSVFLDSMAIAGTNPNINVLVDLIKKKELSGEAAAQIISTFPLYVRTPTPELIKLVYTLADSAAVESDNDQVRTAAILALSNLLYEACVNTRISNTKYPVQIYGQFCDAKTVSREYVHWYIKHLEKYMQSKEQEDKHWAATYLQGLGNLGVEEVIPVVQQLLDDEVDPYFKVKAVFALKHLVISRSTNNIPTTEFRGVDRSAQDLLTDDVTEKQVLPILVSVMSDRSEHPEVRMAAIALLIFNTNADVTIWQQMAYTTWHPSSQEVHAFIYSTIRSLAELKRPLSPIHETMSRKARAVLSMTKPWREGYGKSANFFKSEWMAHVQSGYFQHFQYFGSQDSIIPNYMYYLHNFQYGNDAVAATPIEIDIQGQTIQRLASYMVEQFIQKTSESEPHQELEEIHNILGISQREQDEKPEASFRIKMRQQVERLWSANEESIQQFIAKAKGEYLPQLLNGLPFNYQKTLHLMEHSMEMPSCMGLPVHYHFRMPLHVSLRGQVKIVNQNGLKDVQIQAELHPVYAWKSHGKIAIKSPFSGKQYEAGVMRHVVVETPLRALIRFAPEGHAVFAITPAPLKQGSPAGEIDLVTYHLKPYTAIVTDECWPTVHKEGGKMEIVHAMEEPYKSTQVFESVQKALGLHVKLEEETEYHDQNETPSGWTRFFKRFHTPGCYFNVGWLGAENIRYVERKLSIDVSKSDTKTLGFAVGYKYHKKASVKALWEDSDSDSSQSSEEGPSAESQQQQQDSSAQQSSEQWKQPTRGDRRRAESDDEQQQSEAGRVYAVAVIGKRAPIKSVQENRGQIQKIFSKEYQTTVQYLLQVSHSEGRFYFRAAAGEAANEAAQALPQSHPSLVAIKEIVAGAQNQKTQEHYCTEFEGEYDGPSYAEDLIVLRKRLLAEDLSVKVKGEIQFGPTCKRMPHEIKVVGELKRGPHMTEWAKSKSDQAKQCEEDEKKGFSVSPVCQYVAEQQAAALNHATFKFSFTPLPVPVVNRTLDLEDLGKAYFYPYLSNDQFHEGAGAGQMQVDFRMLPNKEFLDLIITKPHSRFSFRSVKTTRFAKFLLPLTATQSFQNNFADRTLRADSEPACSIEGNTVNTFDNVTYRFAQNVASDCYQILAKDCSGRQPVAVLLKDATAQKKEVVLLLGGQTKIELNLPSSKAPSAGLYGRGKIQVEVNEVKVDSLPKTIYAKDSGEVIAEIEAMKDGGVQVIAKQFQVATNGKWVYVQAHNSLRNRTCGLCGDFNGEKIGEFRGPKDCALSSGSVLVASYSFQSRDPKEKAVCKIHQNVKEQLKHEQEMCLDDSPYHQSSQPKMAYYYSARPGSSAIPAEEDCVKQFSPVVRQAIFEIINAVVKPFEWLTQSRERLVHTLADTCMNKMKLIMAGSRDVKELSEKIQEYVCEEAKKMQLHSLAQEAICKGSKGLQHQAYKFYLNPVAQETKCAEPVKKDFNPVEVAKQIQYAIYDESEQDDSVIPWVAAHKLPMPCPLKLEETLSRSMAKYAYFFLMSDRQMTEVERKRISKEVERAVRQAIKKTMGSNNFAEELTKEIIRLVDRPFPDGSLQILFNKFTQKFVQLTLLKLCKIDKCCFNGPKQLEYPSYQYQSSVVGKQPQQSYQYAQQRGTPSYQ